MKLLLTRVILPTVLLHFAFSGCRVNLSLTALDLVGLPEGTPIEAAAAGTVIYCGWESGYGNLVVLDNGNNLATAYAHQSRIAVSCGAHVAQGQELGEVALVDAGPLLDDAVQRRLRECRLVGLVVAAAPEAVHVDDDVPLELATEVHRQGHRLPPGVRCRAGVGGCPVSM